MGIFTITNTEWLDRLGMEMPTTLDEFYNMLVAFRDEDANGDGDPTNEIPGRAPTPVATPSASLSTGPLASTAIVGTRWTPTPMKGISAPIIRAYKESIAFMKKCWDEGLFQSTFFSGTGEETLPTASQHRLHLLRLLCGP